MIDAAKIKEVGAKIEAVLTESAVWNDCLVRGDDGKVNLDASRRAFGKAAHAYLKSQGEGQSAPRAVNTIDTSNVSKALYASFAAVAKGNPDPSCALAEIEYTTLEGLGVPKVEYERAKRIIHAVLVNPASRFSVIKGATKFHGYRVQLKDKPTMPETFLSWTAMHAK